MNDVLLVDDERAVLDSLLSALDWAEFGFKQVRTAQNAQEAMQIMREHPVDLLLLDILIPGMNGLEKLKSPSLSIRTAYGLPSIPPRILRSHRALMKSSETAPNKGFFAICSPNHFIKCYTVLTSPGWIIRAKTRARKSHNRI